MNAVSLINEDLKTFAPLAKRRRHVVYPIREGEPMETSLHLSAMVDLFETLSVFFEAEKDVFVAADMTTYYEEGNNRKFIAPDVMVVKGVSKHPRRNFLMWKEKIPSVVFELSSKSTRNRDFDEKFKIYERAGIAEYYVFDPEYEYLKPNALVAFKLENGKFVEQKVENSRVVSFELGLEIVDTKIGLRLFNPKTQTFLPTMTELAASERALKTENERLKTELAKLRADKL